MTTVALVDDHEMLRSGLAGLINTFPDFTVIFEAGNGKEFIEHLRFRETGNGAGGQRGRSEKSPLPHVRRNLPCRS